MATALIIEDELLIALDQQTIVEGEGHTIAGIAWTVDEATHQASRFDLDFIIADIRLADDTFGPDAIAKIQSGQDVKVIFVSGNVDLRSREQLRPYNPVAIISKPFNPHQLIEAIRAI